MPIHDFRCPACKTHFELLVRSGATAVCPHCQSTAVEKLLSPPAPQGKSAAIIGAARARAARAGHLSNG
jgi:putative FmdB family regulatory protein